MSKQTKAIICVICLIVGALVEISAIMFTGKGVELHETLFLTGQLIWLFGVGMWFGLAVWGGE